MARLVIPAPDAVSDALRSLSVRSTILCVSELRAPWAFSVTGDAVAKFHVVLEGAAFLVCRGEKPIALTAGDVVVLPRGARHTLAADEALPARALDEILGERPLEPEIRLRYGGEGPLTRLLCGGFSLAEAVPESALALLPDIVHVPGDPRDSTAALRPILDALTAEAESGRPGASAVIAKIADVFLANVLRSWFTRDGDSVPPAGIVGDPAVANAVLALNSSVAEPWSLDRLARRVGLRGRPSRRGSAGPPAIRRCGTSRRFASIRPPRISARAA